MRAAGLLDHRPAGQAIADDSDAGCEMAFGQLLDGTVLGRCMQRHRHQEFIRFLNAVEAAVPT
jgi:hypothetical protein